MLKGLTVVGISTHDKCEQDMCNKQDILLFKYIITPSFIRIPRLRLSSQICTEKEKCGLSQQI